VHCGIKKTGLDLGLLTASRAVPWSGTFTTNAAAAACVRHCRSLRNKKIRAVVVNSGNANACTGAAGEEAVTMTAAAVASMLGCAPNEVLVASTGPIGVPLPTERLTGALGSALSASTSEVDGFARSILTTDTGTKTIRVELEGGSIVGVAKGAAMTAPRMATMLAFITTDLGVASPDLAPFLPRAVDRSFNRLSIDACESTNDSVFLLSSGVAGMVEPEVFFGALQTVCSSLAEQIARDAEGASKLVRISVVGASSEGEAADLGRSVAASALWRAALNGGDPNWGRVVSALGTANRDLDLQRLAIAIGDVTVFRNGEPLGTLDEAAAQMRGPEVSLTCAVGDGPGRATILSADLSADYVKLNAEGAT
jgi:glutamate N-acetyltransferase/amino-acid N-acetyltransferase